MLFEAEVEANGLKITIDSDINDIDKTVDLVGTPNYAKVRETLKSVIKDKLLFSDNIES